jgi:hypothetical protein
MTSSALSDGSASSWKRLAIRSLFGGMGLAVGLAAILGSYWWYASRPKPPKPWNAAAILATYDSVDTGDENKGILFYYVLQNTTDNDFSVGSNDQPKLTAQLAREKSLAAFDDFLKIQLPIFLPARGRVRVFIEAPLEYTGKRPQSGATRDERRQFRKKLEDWLNSDHSNLDGFVLFDATNRYQINFPKGW